MVALDGISASSRRPTKKETDLTHDEVLGFFLHREYFAFSGEREKSLGENGAQQFSCELVVQPLTHSRWYVPYSIVKQPRPFSVVYSSKSKRSEKWYKNCVHISVVLSSGNIRIGFSAKSTILYPHGPYNWWEISQWLKRFYAYSAHFATQDLKNAWVFWHSQRNVAFFGRFKKVVFPS